MTGAGMMECKKALVEADGDMDKAVDVLRTRGLAAVAKKAGRATNEGTVMAIVSDDAASGDVEGIDPAFDGFKQYGRDVAMQVAAAAPVAATREAVDPAVVEHEKAIYMAQAAESGKPEAIQEKMAVGRLEKFFKESTLTEQAFVKNPDQSVHDYTAEVATNLGGEIKIVDFKRFVLGE